MKKTKQWQSMKATGPMVWCKEMEHSAGPMEVSTVVTGWMEGEVDLENTPRMMGQYRRGNGKMIYS